LKRERDRDYVPWSIFFRGLFSSEPRCTRCAHKRITPSRQEPDFLSRMCLLTPYRCHGCNKRFVIRLTAEDHRRRKSRHEADSDTIASA
jgi:hypothetical protein